MVTEEPKPKKKVVKRQSKFKQALASPNKKYIDEAVNFWLDRGVDPKLIGGIFGNISLESSWNPEANAKDSGLGDYYGLVLMSPDMRKEVKRVYGKIDSNTTHLFIYDAMTGNKKISKAWREYMTLNGGYWNNAYHDAETAAMAFGNVFERPNERYAEWGERMSSAKDAYDYVINAMKARELAKAGIPGDNNLVLVFPRKWEDPALISDKMYYGTSTEYPLNDKVPESISSWSGADSPSKGPRMPSLTKLLEDLLRDNPLNGGFKPEATIYGRRRLSPLSLKLPSLDQMLDLDSPQQQMTLYFADALQVPRMHLDVLPAFYNV